MNRKQFLKQAVLALIGTSLIPEILQSKTEAVKEIEELPYKKSMKFFMEVTNTGNSTFKNIDLLDVNILKNRNLKVSHSIKPFDANVSTYNFLRSLKEKPFLVKRNGVGIFHAGHNNHNFIIKNISTGNNLYNFQLERNMLSLDRNHQGYNYSFFTNEVKFIIPVFKPNQTYHLTCELL